MPRGFSAVAAAANDINERKNAGGDFEQKKYLRLPNDKDKATVRFLEAGDDVVSSWCHVVPHARIKWGIKIPCIDQDAETGERVGKDCPGCEEGYKRVFQGWINLIWRDAPVYKTDDNGKPDFDDVVGHEDQVVLWQSGINVFEDLQIQDETYGLDSREFIVRRSGTGKNTTYAILPVDGGPTPLSKADTALAEGKFDLDAITAPPEYEYWGKTRKDSDDSDEEQEPVRESPFKNRRR